MSSAPSKSIDQSKAAETREFVSDSLATGVIFALLLTVVQRIVGFVRNILFCKIMTVEQLGQWSMVYSFLMLLAPLAVLGLPGSFCRFAEHYRKKGQLGAFVGRIGRISVALTLLLAASMLAIPGRFSNIFFRDAHQVSIVYGMAFALLFVAASNFLASLMESLRQVRVVTIMRFITGVSFAAFGTGLMLVWKDKALAATVGFGLASICTIIPGIVYLVRNRSTFANTTEKLTHSAMWKRIAPFALWLWFANVLQNMFELSDRAMLVHWSAGAAELAHNSVGQYHSGRVIPLLLVGVAAVLEGILLPFMTARVEEGKTNVAREQLNWTIKLIAISFTVASMVVILFAPLLFDWVLEGRYNDGLAVLPLTMVYCIWFSISIVGQSFAWVAEKGKWVMAATGVALILNVGINALLIPHYGLWGAVIATSVACFALMAMVLELNRWLKCPTDKGVWISAAIPFVLLLPMTVLLPVVAIITMIGLRSQLIFTTKEKEKLTREVTKVLGKVSGFMGR